MVETEIVKLIGGYMMAWPQSKANAGTLLIYSRALDDLPIQVIDAAMQVLIKTAKFFPSVVEIRDAATSLAETATGMEKKSADEAWAEVLQQLHDAFVYREPVFSAPEIKRAALNMGWTSLCGLPVEQMNTARAQFRDIYNSMVTRKKNKKINSEILARLGTDAVAEIGSQLPANNVVSIASARERRSGDPTKPNLDELLGRLKC